MRLRCTIATTSNASTPQLPMKCSRREMRLRVLGQVERIELAEAGEALAHGCTGFLVRLGAVPVAILRVQRQRRQFDAIGRGQRFHRAEAALELGVGAAQRAADIDLRMPREVGADEQQVADLVLEPVARSGVVRDRPRPRRTRRGLPRFPRAAWRSPASGPGQSKPTRAARCLQLHRALPFRQAAGDAGQRGRVGMARRRRARARLCSSHATRLRLGIVDRARRRTHADAGAPSCR